MAFQLVGTDRERLSFGNARMNELLLGKRGGGMTATSRLHGLLNFADGLAVMGGAWDVVGNFSVATNKLTCAAATGNTAIAGTLAVTGAAAFSSTLSCLAATIVGNSTVTGTFGVTGVTTITGATNITGATAVTGALSVSTTSTLTGAVACGSTLSAAGTSTLAAVNMSGAFNLNGGKFTIASANGNTVCAGTLNVTGATTLAAGLSVGTTANVIGNLLVNTDKFVVTAANGNIATKGSFAIATTKFTVSALGAVSVDGGNFTVSAAGAVHCASDFDVSGTLFTVKPGTSEVGVGGSGTLTIPAGDSVYVAAGAIKKISSFLITHLVADGPHDSPITLPTKCFVTNVWTDTEVAATGAPTLNVGYTGAETAYLVGIAPNPVAGLAVPAVTWDGTSNWLVSTTFGASLYKFVAGASATVPGSFTPVMDVACGGQKIRYEAPGADATIHCRVFVEYVEVI